MQCLFGLLILLLSFNAKIDAHANYPNHMAENLPDFYLVFGEQIDSILSKLRNENRKKTTKLIEQMNMLHIHSVDPFHSGCRIKFVFTLVFYLISLVNLVQSVVTSPIKEDILFNRPLALRGHVTSFL